MPRDKGYEIIFTEGQYEKVEDRHSEEVAEKLLDKLESKQEEVKWIQNFNKLNPRFQSFFGCNGAHFAEPGFEAENREYRAIMIVDRRTNCIVFYRAVKKEDHYNSSKQKKIIENLENRSKDAIELAGDKVLEIQNGESTNLL